MKESETHPLITIGMPVYNVENYISDALYSVLNQTYPNLEIIIVNDKTPDKSIEIVEKITSMHPRKNSVRILHHDKNRGLSYGRNTVINNAKGKYIYFIDSDDYIESHCIETLYNFIKKYNVDFAEASYDIVSNNKSKEKEECHIEHHIKDEECILNQKEKAPPAFMDSYYPFTTAWNKLIDLDLLRKEELYFQVGRLYEDSYFTFSLNLKATSCYISPEITYHYRIREDSIMHKGVDKYSKREIEEHNLYINWQKKLLYQCREKIYYDTLCKDVVFATIQLTKVYIRKRENIEIENITPYIKELLISPFTLKDILNNSQNKKYNIMWWLFFSLPYPLQYFILKTRC